MECQNSPPQQNAMIITVIIPQTVAGSIAAQITVSTVPHAAIPTAIPVNAPSAIQEPPRPSIRRQQWDAFKKDPFAYASKVFSLLPSIDKLSDKVSDLFS